MSSSAEATSYLTDNGYSLHARATIGAIARISVEQGNHELQQMCDADESARAYVDALAAHDIVSGDALLGVMDMVHGYKEKVPVGERLPVAAVLRNRHSSGRPMAIVGLLSRARPFEVLFATDQEPEQQTESGIVIATVALSLRGFVQAVKGETKAHCSKPNQPGHAFIDVMRYIPDAVSGLVSVGHNAALAVASGAEVQPMLDEHELGILGRVMEDKLEVSLS